MKTGGKGGNLVLGTPQERIRLLKAGVDGKLIEKLYVERNNFKVVGNHLLFNQVGGNNKKIKVPTVSFGHHVFSSWGQGVENPPAFKQGMNRTP